VLSESARGASAIRDVVRASVLAQHGGSSELPLDDGDATTTAPTFCRRKTRRFVGAGRCAEDSRDRIGSPRVLDDEVATAQRALRDAGDDSARSRRRAGSKARPCRA